MSRYDVPALHHHITIDAPPAAVWGLVGDVTRMAQWSPQVESTRLADATAPVGTGTRFTNRNTHGELAWITHGEIVEHMVGRHLAFRIEENWAVWSFELVDGGDGTTLLHQRRDAPDGISELSRELTDGFLGGQEVFTATLEDGMRTTLDRIKAAVEGAPG